MKKMFAMLLVLGLVSVSSAAIESLIVKEGGVAISGDVIYGGGMISLELGGEASGFEFTMAAADGAAIDTSGVSFASGWDLPGSFVNDTATNVRATGSQLFSAAKPAGFEIATGFMFDIPVGSQVQIVDAVAGTTVATLLPVPEPITMTLLGVGGLLALRRRR